ncbi:hypothetical protein ACFOW6_16625 [Fodinicurvata halophila]|uniref:Cytosine permease n=1 Tax=Fodinicurvata halophila TaxID=1419723 RepID=A0ABV8URG2_9PROT
MSAAIKFSLSWVVAMACLTLPLAAVSGALVDVGAGASIAFLSGAIASMAAFLGIGYLATVAGEKLGVSLFPRTYETSSLRGVLLGIGIGISGSWAVVSIASTMF